VLFSQGDRELHSEYDIADPTIRSSPPGALANLLWIAELDLEHLWREVEDENKGAARTRERRANENLRSRLGPKWSQESIEVQFNVSGTVLEVLVVETSNEGADTPITERSDGLRMFVALVAFLARHGFERPPILLVDEAETHLHYDAQADLVEVLTNDVEASQVFYTTHSPGCLPRDLGTGVRLVAPAKGRRDASELRNDFWTNESPGFTPLLFAMGAGAAAFSAFRKAVLAEGAADMILLPSLFRIATELSDLPYQVAPGLANHHGSGLELEETAARVVYLLDGDGGGDEHRKRLTDLGIEKHRIFQFDENTAPEDYVDPDRYLEVVNALINSTGRSAEISVAELDQNVPISKAVSDWCKQHDIRPPGKPVIASVLVGDPERLALANGAKRKLAALHRRMVKTLDAPPGLAS
jgi:predicted ATP-dependent endonuclease of OLD family